MSLTTEARENQEVDWGGLANLRKESPEEYRRKLEDLKGLVFSPTPGRDRYRVCEGSRDLTPENKRINQKLYFKRKEDAEAFIEAVYPGNDFIEVRPSVNSEE